MTSGFSPGQKLGNLDTLLAISGWFGVVKNFVYAHPCGEPLGLCDSFIAARLSRPVGFNCFSLAAEGLPSRASPISADSHACLVT